MCSIGAAEVVVGDLTDSAAVERLLQGAHAVIHLAGVAHTALRTKEDRDKAWRVNVGGTRLLLELSKRMGVRRALLISSAHVYKQHRGSGIDESAPTGNDDLYSRTKQAVEELAVTDGQGVDIVIIRPCLTYGAGVRFNLERLMTAVDRGYYFHLSGQDPMRSFLSVHNAAAAIVHLLDRGVDRQIYNVADERADSLVTFTNRLAECMNRRRPRVLPYGLARAVAFGLTPLTRLGMKTPMDREALSKLTDTFTVSIRKLAESGFAWPDTGEFALRQMVEFYKAGNRRDGES